VEQCLESIFCQDYNDIELIVIDDTSKDNSLEVINRVLDSYK
jgi:glycosyltransferase involved in cell wall biosynthesis